MVLDWIAAISYLVLAVLCVRFAIRRPGATSFYALIAFGSIGGFIILALVDGLAEIRETTLYMVMLRIAIVLLFLFPWGLYRFSRTVAPRSWRWTGWLVDSLLVVLCISGELTPDLSKLEASDQPVWVPVFVAVGIVFILALCVISTFKLFWNSRGQGDLVRKRLRTLAYAAAALTAALLMSEAFGDPDEALPLQSLTYLLVTVAGILFICGLSAPRMFRLYWAQPHLSQVRLTTAELLEQGPSAELSARLIASMAEIVGSNKTAIVFDDGREPIAVGIDSADVPSELASNAKTTEFPISGGRIIIWANALWPFVEKDEIALMSTIAALLDVSIKREYAENLRREVEVAHAVEETLRNEAAQREAIIEQRTQQLRQSNDDLRSFAYAASHDLQAPLRTVGGFSEMLLGRLDKSKWSEEEHLMAYHIHEGVAKMQRLIQDLLSYGRVGSGSSRPQRLSIAAVTADIVELLASDLQATGGKVSVDSSDWVLMDAGHLRQILQNLLQNALTYRDEQRPPEVHVSTRAVPPAMVEVTVRDNGRGIRQDDYQRVFEMFKTLRPGPGTGMGLALVKRIVDRYGGEIHIESTEGVGSSFIFTLPSPARRSAVNLSQDPADVLNPN